MLDGLLRRALTSLKVYPVIFVWQKPAPRAQIKVLPSPQVIAWYMLSSLWSITFTMLAIWFALSFQVRGLAPPACPPPRLTNRTSAVCQAVLHYNHVVVAA